MLEGVHIDELDLGSRPFRLDSIRLLTTQEDELILEVGVWGFGTNFGRGRGT